MSINFKVEIDSSRYTAVSRCRTLSHTTRVMGETAVHNDKGNGATFVVLYATFVRLHQVMVFYLYAASRYAVEKKSNCFILISASSKLNLPFKTLSRGRIAL